jgi:CxxC motif-containing protein (DUF1111 family)
MFMHTTFVLCLCSLSMVFAQSDPGPRQGPPDAGRPLPNLLPQEDAVFQDGARRFRQVVSVSGTEPGARDAGLGPRFNSNSCVSCHAHPSAGGASPPRNPQLPVAVQFGAQNVVPSFLKPNGPVLITRFVANADGSPDGGVHELFTITGRSDAGQCNIQQPDFETALANNNIAFRIPTPLYGLGLIEAIPDTAILANRAANADAKKALGIAGQENRNGNDGTITRFGWKAQNKSLELFSAEAYNVEMGVTNEVFPNERDETQGCVINPLPEDQPRLNARTAVAAYSDTTAFASFMRWLAPPQPANAPPVPGAPPANPDASVARGQQVFAQIGCALCHTPMFNTGPSTSPSLDRKPAPLFSDLLLHRMGVGLVDGVAQGQAAGDEFRTAPLWGLGQRIFLLHDGRTTDLLKAIDAHASSGSEANGVVDAFHALPASSVQDLLNFLRSL